MFGEIEKALRKQSNLRLCDVADKLDISIASLSKYENNTREPSLELLTKFCDLYDVSADFILGRAEKETIQ